MSTVDFLVRLALALPLVLALLGGFYFAARRGWVKLPGALLPGAPAAMRLLQTAALGPGAKLIVVEFDGRLLLIAAHRSGVSLIAPGGPL